MSGTHSLIAPIPIGTEAAPPFVRLPDLGTVFARRAERCRQLAEGHALEPYLRFIAALAAAQNDALGSLPAGLLPGKDDLAHARTAGSPLLHRLDLQGGGTWILALRVMLECLGSYDMPGAARTAVADLDSRSWTDLLMLGQRVLDGTCEEHESAAACFVMAALQVSWTRAAASIDPQDVQPLESPGLCPMCGSRPVASVVHAVGSLQGTRFLHCALCATEWHFVRIKCPNCASTKGIAYQQIEGGDGAVKAETCEECGTYTKSLSLERDHRLEPFADDLASYALDVLVEEAGWRRAAPNPFLVPMGS
jgi:FdhE protein